MDERIRQWLATRHFVAIGNLGEQVSLRLLDSLDYLVIATQDDLAGGISNILETYSTIHAEDFVCKAPDGRLTTVNSKATASPSGSGFDRGGNLRRPRISRGQRSLPYTSERAELIDYPMEGDAWSQVLKVDLLIAAAQLFDVDERGRLEASGPVVDVNTLIADILVLFPGETIPPPSAHDL